MLNFTTFSHESFGNVRSIMFDDEPWFVAMDVCECLGIGNYRQALTYLDYDEKDVIIGDTPDMNRTVTIIINESGLYTLKIRYSSVGLHMEYFRPSVILDKGKQLLIKLYKEHKLIMKGDKK